MKKLLSILLSTLMICALATPAFAATTVDNAADLQTAFNNGGDVVLGADITSTSTLVVPAGVTVTLDLNGKTLSGVDTTALYSLIHVKNSGNLIIEDNSANQDGKVSYDCGSENKTGTAIFVEGELTLESGIIEITGEWSIGFAVDAHPNAWGTTYTEPTTFTMNGGKIVASDSGVRVANYSAAGAAESATFTMNGGEITSKYDSIFVQHVVACDLNVEINGGTITSDTHAIRIYGSVVNDVNVDVKGGDITGNLTNMENTGAGKTEISGGTFSVDVTDYVVDGVEQDEEGTVVPVGSETEEPTITCAGSDDKNCDGVVTCDEVHGEGWDWNNTTKACEFFGTVKPNVYIVDTATK